MNWNPNCVEVGETVKLDSSIMGEYVAKVLRVTKLGQFCIIEIKGKPYRVLTLGLSPFNLVNPLIL